MPNHYFPKAINEPFRIILFTLDEFIPISFCIIIGFASGAIVSGFVIAALILAGMKNVKGENGPRFWFQVMYWYGPSGIFGLKVTPPSHFRLYRG